MQPRYEIRGSFANISHAAGKFEEPLATASEFLRNNAL